MCSMWDTGSDPRDRRTEQKSLQHTHTHSVSQRAWNCDTLLRRRGGACFCRRTDGDELLDADDDAITLLVPAPLAPLARQRLVHQLAHLLRRDGDPAAFRLRLRVCTTTQMHFINTLKNPEKSLFFVFLLKVCKTS